MSLKQFYEKLLKNGSYYNAFLRVRERLEEKKIIDVYYSKSTKKKMIQLTDKGITIKQILITFEELVK